MKILSFVEKDIKYFLIILGVTGFFQFMFSEAFIFPSALPINIPAEPYLLALGAVSFYIFFVSLIVVSLILSNKIKGLLPIAIVLVASPFLPILHLSYLVYYGIEVFIIIISFATLVETFMKSDIRSFLFLPTLALVCLGLIASFSIDFYHDTLTTNYLDFFAASAISFTVYSILWKNILNKRSLIAYILGIVCTVPFIQFAHQMLTNRYIEILMEMILPSALGITIYNPSHIIYLVYILALTTFSIVSIIIKGNGSAGIGYFLIISNVFFGTYGYLLLFYMMLPTIGYVIMNYNEIKERNLLSLLSSLRTIRTSHKSNA
ncbi:cytochrome b558/566 subunit B [Sulfolobus tengchongensis]|uniref:Cytochrome b558/566 subunit B n=1 Tax=Sulfolobus tengchongensis TaxID=207809 RepID=A0AAX4KXB3_9CREN